MGGRALTNELKKLAGHVVNVLPDGTQVTRAEALAELIWKYALGWVEETRDEHGNRRKVEHPPVAWAMQYVFERSEGKAPVANAEASTGMRAADRVRELARDRINSMAAVAAGPPKMPRKHEAQDGQGNP